MIPVGSVHQLSLRFEFSSYPFLWIEFWQLVVNNFLSFPESPKLFLLLLLLLLLMAVPTNSFQCMSHNQLVCFFNESSLSWPLKQSLHTRLGAKLISPSPSLSLSIAPFFSKVVASVKQLYGFQNPQYLQSKRREILLVDKIVT